MARQKKSYIYRMDSISQITTELKNELVQLYGNQLVDMVLFGSYARGTQHPDSDIDIAIILKSPDIQSTDEIARIVPVSAALSVKHGVLLSVLPVSEKKLRTSMQGVYQEIRREGIRL